jgi:signal transduction histidine kinase
MGIWASLIGHPVPECHNPRVADRIVSIDGRRTALLVICALAIAHALAFVLAPLRATPFPAYAGASRLTIVPDTVAGIGLLATGLLVIALGGRGRVGGLAVLASIAWEGGAPVARSVGLVVAPFLAPLLLDLVVSATAWDKRRGPQVIVAGTYALTAVASVGRALVRDPFVDLDCGSNCRDNVFLVFPDPGLAATLNGLLEVARLFGTVALMGYVIGRLVMTTEPDRRASLAVLVPGALVAVAECSYALALLRSPLDGADDPAFVGMFAARAIASTTLAIGIGWVVVKARVTADSVARITRDLAAATGPGGLRDALARALGDPALRVVYWLPQAALYVDETGAAVDVVSLPAGRVATPIVRGGERIALVVHQSGVDAKSLTRDIGAAARLAAENERLQAEVRMQIVDMQASRRRIVATTDDHRRGLERDLHDGAQQRMLALSYELRLAQAAAERDGPPGLAIALGRASGETLAAIDELRELAHGIFPVILAEAGLQAALETLADRSALPLRMSIEIDNRCPAATEATAYLVIDEAIRSAARRGATAASVGVSRSVGLLLVRVEDDAPAQHEDVTHLVDRVGALGGRLVDTWLPRGHELRAEIPCV